ncbi:MAG: hypothetical protein IT355_20465 [Gemmatimonadaceae bacterium]|nr:hypothetical protein [Gemmatimonadaceae bacterium]
MPTIKTLRLLALAGALTLSACASAGRPGPGAVYVRYGPPPRVVEVVGLRPGPGAVWVPGHHAWRGNGYVWIGGRYEYPARGFRRWEAGRWRHSRSGWYWSDGRWR